MEYKKIDWWIIFFSPLNISVFLNHSYLEYNSKCLHKNVGALLINWTGLVSGQWVDRYDLPIPIFFFFLCLQNRIVTPDTADSSCRWTFLGTGVWGATEACQASRNSELTPVLWSRTVVQLECLHSRKGFYSPCNRFI